MDGIFWLYAGFTLFVLFVLALDLGVFHKTAHEVSFKEAAIWSTVWVVLALAFNVLVYFIYENHWLGAGTGELSEKTGAEAAKTFFLGYVVEKSLAVDNVFVWALLFTYFNVPAKYQHRVLFWGVVGAILMRAIFIALGAALISQFGWILYLFGFFLILTAIKMLLIKHDEDVETGPSSTTATPAAAAADAHGDAAPAAVMAVSSKQAAKLEKNPVLRLCRRLFWMTNTYHGQQFFISRDQLTKEEVQEMTGARPMHEGIVDVGNKHAVDTEASAMAKAAKISAWVATPMFVVLILVETTDLIFAVDSIPAIFGITQDPFIVFTSNICAILGLRAMYFLLAGVMHKFYYLKAGLAYVLGFIGVKMCVNHFGKDYAPLANYLYHTGWGKEIIPTTWSLLVVATILTVAITASLRRAKREEAARAGTGPGASPTPAT